MTRLSRLVLLFFFLAFSSMAGWTPAKAQLGALTIGAVIQNIGELAKQLENGAQALLQQGNTALAQQQMLAAGILRQLVSQLDETYKGSLDKTFDKLGTAQSNLATDVTQVLQQVAGIEKKTASDAQATVYQMQTSVNQLLNKLPFTSREPVFYGMMVHDIYAEIQKKGVDLELLGLNLTDPKLDFKQPAITVAGQPIPKGNISIQENRIQIVLPEAIKAKVGFTDDYCKPPSSFAASMQVFYKTTRKLLFIPIKRETSVTFNAFALAGKESYVATTDYSGTLTTKTDETKTFSTKSGQVTYGCEENNSGGVSYTLPDGAAQVQCAAGWVDLSNTKTQSASCAVGGATVTASGTVRGRDRECIVSDVLSGGLIKVIVGRNTACNCPGGGHGALLLQGTYHVSQTLQSQFSTPGKPQRFLEEAQLPIPSDDAKRVEKISVTIKRPQCNAVLDDVSMELPKEKPAIATQTSANGLFKATYRSEALHLERSQ